METTSPLAHMSLTRVIYPEFEEFKYKNKSNSPFQTSSSFHTPLIPLQRLFYYVGYAVSHLLSRWLGKNIDQLLAAVGAL